MNFSVGSMVKATVLALGLGLGASLAGAATVGLGDAGKSWTVDFTCTASADCAGVTGRGQFTLTSVSTIGPLVQWAVDLVMTNTSATGTAGFLTAMGFNTSPNAVMSNVHDVAGGTTWDAGAGSIPSLNTELCVWDGNNCSASNDHTMTAGKSDGVTFLLTTLATATLVFDNYGVKFAGVGQSGGSYEFSGTEVSTVPLPAGLPLLAGGLGAMGLLFRRKARKAA